MKVKIVLSIFIMAIILSGCENNNRTIAEDYAISYFQRVTARVHTVDESVYDEKTDKYIVYLLADGDEIRKEVIVGVKNGTVISIDLGDGERTVIIQGDS